MFSSRQQVIDVPVDAARARLATLIQGGWLSRTSDEVYQRSADDLLRVGPFGDKPGASRLVRVQFTDPACHGGVVQIGLRWEAVGLTGGLFPALDADITLVADGQRTQVSLTGTYRPPLGALGAGLDRLLLRKVAAATIADFLARISGALTGAAAEPGQPAALAWPALEPEPTPG